MQVLRCCSGVVLALIAVASPPLAMAQASELVAGTAMQSSGAIVGVVTDSAKHPVVHVTVSAHRTGGGLRATVSSSDGTYSFADLPPGSWTIMADVDGVTTSAPVVTVVADKVTRLDFVMSGARATG